MGKESKTKSSGPKKEAAKKKDKGQTFDFKGGPAIDPTLITTGLENEEAVCRGLERFVDGIVQYMIERHEADDLAGKKLYWVTMTVPTPKRNASLLYGYANVFAEWCSDEGGTAWLMADWSHQKMGHWHGLVLTSRTPKEMKSKWNSQSGGGWSSQHFERVWNQKKPKSPAFQTDIAKIVNYASKDVSLEVSRTERAVAAGDFAELWEESMGQPPKQADYMPPLGIFVHRKTKASSKKNPAVVGKGKKPTILFIPEKQVKKEIAKFGPDIFERENRHHP